MAIRESAAEHGSLLTSIEQAPAASRGDFYRRRGKRACDIAGAAVLLVVLAPVLLAVACGVLISSGWPVLYASERIGRGGRRFGMWKFRTMVRDADVVLAAWQLSHPELAREYARNFKLKRDPRITRLGGFLRRSSLDELPQLWNVLRGQMSLVGPRPYLPSLCPDDASWDAIVGVRPGISGPWQVGGRSTLSPRQRMALDVTYAGAISLRGDLVLLARVVKPLLRLDGQ